MKKIATSLRKCIEHDRSGPPVSTTLLPRIEPLKI